MFDVIVIGGGPAGLSESIRLLGKDLKVAVVSDFFGGCMGMMGDLPLQSYCNELEIAGAPLPLRNFMQHLSISPTGSEYANYIKGNFEALPFTLVQDRVLRLKKNADLFEMVLGDARNKRILRASQVILATGIRPKCAPIPLQGTQWKSCFDVYSEASCEQIESYRDKDVFIFGSGNSAFQIALLLAPLARNITILVKSYLGLYPQETDNRFALRSLSQRTLEMIAKSTANTCEGPLNNHASASRARLWLHAYSELQAVDGALRLVLSEELNSHPLLKGSCEASAKEGLSSRLNDAPGYVLRIDYQRDDCRLVSATGITAQLPATDWPQLLDQSTGFAAHQNGQSPIDGLYVAGAASGYASVNTMIPSVNANAEQPLVQERVSWA
ncbi:NAD(P)/FAD-dependent oxidoreductase [Pseudomonas syringae]|uniref:NAD(P)/FAD-dependent oxidoreductase n=2 Tax=Pseudomonas syringae TaxID=317 RepID=UPI00190F6C92|nr:FAD-dependent oxidoreductase [Pseudomonas syringae]UQB26153.1 NAD(P)/FAD-dependent oxidoreductase [Pseudomonas syringae]